MLTFHGKGRVRCEYITITFNFISLILYFDSQMGVKLWERAIESQQHSMQRSASSVECNEAMWEGPVMQKVKVHHRVFESPAGTLEHPITNEIPYDQESLVRITCNTYNL